MEKLRDTRTPRMCSWKREARGDPWYLLHKLKVLVGTELCSFDCWGNEQTKEQCIENTKSKISSGQQEEHTNNLKFWEWNSCLKLCRLGPVISNRVSLDNHDKELSLWSTILMTNHPLLTSFLELQERSSGWHSQVSPLPSLLSWQGQGRKLTEGSIEASCNGKGKFMKGKS